MCGEFRLVEGLSNKRIEQNARRSAAQRQAGRVCSCAMRWAKRESAG